MAAAGTSSPRLTYMGNARPVGLAIEVISDMMAAGRIFILGLAAALLLGCGSNPLDFPKGDAGPDGSAATGGSGGSTGGSGGSTGGSSGVDGGGGTGASANGTQCSSGAECTSGHCADGVCCDTACADICSACTAALKGVGDDGSCGPVSAGTDPDSECEDQSAQSCGTDGSCDGNGKCELYAAGTECAAQTCTNGTKTFAKTCDGKGLCNDNGSQVCSPAVCQGPACASGCSDDAQCAQGQYCDIASGDCKAKLDNGQACQATKANQCSSGFCADSVCCDAACTGKCESCKGSVTGGNDGTCLAAPVGSDPDGDCLDQGVATCGTNGVCDGNKACQYYSSSTQCVAAGCSGSTYSPASLCSGSGTCVTATPQTCAPFICDASGCKTSCSGTADCVNTFVCIGGSCAVPQTNGATCANAGQCASGFCVDGVCCNAPCNGTCEACSAAKKGIGNDGICAPIASGSDPDNECTTAASSSCGTMGTCDGSGACALYPSGTTCAPAACTNGVFSPADQCNGLGTCVDSGSTSCAPYVCTSTGCKTSCAGAGDCLPGFTCAGGSCHSAGGTPCSAPGDCSSNYCVDGVCCDAPCTGTCQACTAAKKGGGTDGTCGPVAIGTDPDDECADQGAPSCGTNGVCNGANACALYTSGTVCSAANCSNPTFKPAGACNGSGTCVTTSQSCVPYGCSSSGCKSSCSSDNDCAPSYSCNTTIGVCGLLDGKPCTSSTQCKSTYCVDGVCCGTSCTGTCKACSAAKTGGTDGTCANIKNGTDPDNECYGSQNCNYGHCS